MINKVILVGRITRDPELQSTGSGISFTRFSLAVNRTFTNQQGEREADFINCIAWRNQAENLARFIKKGALIAIEGRIQTGSYEAEDGTMRYTTDVVADSIQFLEPKNDAGNSSYKSSGYNEQPAPKRFEPKPKLMQQQSKKEENYLDQDFSEVAGMDIEDDLPF